RASGALSPDVQLAERHMHIRRERARGALPPFADIEELRWTTRDERCAQLRHIDFLGGEKIQRAGLAVALGWQLADFAATRVGGEHERLGPHRERIEQEKFSGERLTNFREQLDGLARLSSADEPG